MTQQVPGRRKVGAQYERRSAGEFEDGQNRADRTDAEIAISGVKGGGAIWILQSEALRTLSREQLYGRHRARTKRKKRRAPRVATSRTPDRIRAGKERRIRDTDTGEGRGVLRRDWPLGLDRSSGPIKERRVKPTLEKSPGYSNGTTTL